MNVFVFYLFQTKSLNRWILLWFWHSIDKVIKTCPVWRPELLIILPLIHYVWLCLLESACLFWLVVMCTGLWFKALSARLMKATLGLLSQILPKCINLIVLRRFRIWWPTDSWFSLLLQLWPWLLLPLNNIIMTPSTKRGIEGIFVTLLIWALPKGKFIKLLLLNHCFTSSKSSSIIWKLILTFRVFNDSVREQHLFVFRGWIVLDCTQSCYGVVFYGGRVQVVVTPVIILIINLVIIHKVWGMVDSWAALVIKFTW